MITTSQNIFALHQIMTIGLAGSFGRSGERSVSMKNLIVACLIACFAGFPTVSFADDESPFARWESAIQKFEADDTKQAPPQNAILFVGSSSIRLWDLKKSFPDRVTINRGFGGSEIADSIHFADRIIIRHKPRIVVLYAGDNDIGKGKTPERVTSDFRKFAEVVHKELPETRIVFVAIKPSIKRWNLIESVRTANTAIRRICEQDDQLVFLDVDQPMIGDDGRPRPELFAKDGLHLSEDGYKLWNSLLRPHLQK
jgi:lysophospholipase L1-like esterase